MSVDFDAAPRPTLVPQPHFEVVRAGHRAYAAAPTMMFAATAADTSGQEIQSMALSIQVMIDPARRGYDGPTRERLAELFGPPAHWAPSTSGMAWARVSTVVPEFAGETGFEIEVPCTYDLEVASAKYLHALPTGVVPLSFHFSGTVFYRGPGGSLQVAPVPWSATAQFGMPIDAWRAMIATHYPGGGWIRLSADTLDALNARRGARGLPSFDVCVAELLGEESDDAR